MQESKRKSGGPPKRGNWKPEQEQLSRAAVPVAGVGRAGGMAELSEPGTRAVVVPRQDQETVSFTELGSPRTPVKWWI